MGLLLLLIAMKPFLRWDPFTTTVEGHFCTWGGCTKDFSKEKSSTLHIFNPKLEIWGDISTTGSPSPGLYSGACASVGHNLYLFGGTNGLHFNNSLHRLNTKTSTWTRLVGDCPPMKKIGCGMITYSGKLLLFGGYGYPSGLKQSGPEFIECSMYDDGRGWSNELDVFDIKEGEEI